MIVYRTAYKIADEWHVLGPVYSKREDAQAYLDRGKAINPNRETLVVSISDEEFERANVHD